MYLYQLNLTPEELTAIVEALNGLDTPSAKLALTKATALADFAFHNEAAEGASETYRAIYTEGDRPIWEMP